MAGALHSPAIDSLVQLFYKVSGNLAIIVGCHELHRIRVYDVCVYRENLWMK